METELPAPASSPSADSPTLDEAVAWLVECGFAAEEPTAPSFVEPPIELPLQHSPEEIEIDFGLGMTHSSRTERKLNEIGPVTNISTAGYHPGDRTGFAGFPVCGSGAFSEPESKLAVSAKLKPRRRRTPKQDLEKLRYLVESLTLRRDELRQQAQRKTQVDSHLGEEEKENRQRNAALWEQVANVQRCQRERSEVENGRLKKMLQTQRRKTLYLKRVLKASCATDAEVGVGFIRDCSDGEVLMVLFEMLQIMEQVFGLKSADSLARATAADDAAVFEVLASKLDEMYLGTVLHPFSLHWSNSLNIPTAIFTNENRKSVPFSQQVAERAVWDSMGERGIRGGKNYCINCDERAFNTRTSSWRAAYRDKLQVDVLIRKVARKFVNEDSTVVVSRALMQPTSFGSVSLSGLEYWEDRYVVIKSGAYSKLGPTSSIFSYLSVERSKDDGSGNDRSRARSADLLAMYELVAWQNLVAARTQTLENLLLEENGKQCHIED
ncbi:unnamed protein product [Phytophthora lilii]|uniref:Unnamed protein product n=1 Tax=Phytophthora lilii TaxID=2077276 RepID=A0A9W7CNH3_9STRA|nr:unnamed protein product [Phytophthora lilii]